MSLPEESDKSGGGAPETCYQHLFQLIDRLDQLLKRRGSDHELRAGMDALLIAFHACFEKEAQCLTRQGGADRERRRQALQEFKRKVEQFESDIRAGRKCVSPAAIQCFSRWLTNHMLENERIRGIRMPRPEA